MPRLTHLSLVSLSLLFSAPAAAARPAEPFPAATATPASAALSLRISGFHSAAGQVLIAVYRGADGFPGKPERAWHTAVAKISDGQARVEISDLEPGEYAVAVVHDENSNNTLDTSWLGMPREGIGMSNNARGRMGPPKYRDARFSLTAAGATQAITILYL